MKIENNILKYYLRNVYFITGTAYAGKSTMVKMLAERYDMVFCGENYFTEVTDMVADPVIQPDLCYIKSLTDFKDFVTRSPEEYERWIYGVGREAAGFEIAELISLSRNKKVIVDTNIPLDILKEISDYNHVAVMLSPQSMSVERFFDRSDPEKQFILSVIDSCENSEKVMENYRKGLALINSKEHYEEFLNSGFFTLIREDNGKDTRKEVCDKLAKHFGLVQNMTIVEICDMLRVELFNNDYEYGFIVNGQKYKPNMENGFDEKYYRLSTTIYRVQEPITTMKEKIGTCVDAVLVMKWLLDKHNIPNKIWLLHNMQKNKVHTVLTFEAENKVVYLELTPQSSKAWYGKEIIYSNEQEFLREYENNGYDVSDVTDSIVIGQQPEFLLAKLN